MKMVKGARAGMFVRVYRLAMISVIFAGVALLAGCSGPQIRDTSQNKDSSQASLVNNAPSLPRATVLIPRGQDLFVPFILVVRPGTRITWQNNDTAAHNIVTIGSAKSFVNPQAFRLHTPPGGSISFALTRPGIYDYFDPLRATWNGTDHRIAANKGVPHYPLAMEGIIWVQGPINGLSTHEINTIPGKDDFFQDFIAIPRGGKVTWNNTDMDNHTIALVPGWQKPINPVSLGSIEVKGKAEQIGGGTKTQAFSTPGLYYYFCTTHAIVNTRWHRAQARNSASELPIPMEGFVLVTDSPT